MPKTITAAMRAHLVGETTRLCTMWRIERRDGQSFFFTDHDRDLVFGGDTYLAATGFDRTAISNDLTFAVDNLDLVGIIDPEEINETEIRAGAFDGAEVTAEIRGLAQPLAQSTLQIYAPECRADLGNHRCKFPLWPDVVARETAYEAGEFVRSSNGGGSLAADFDDVIYECTVAGTSAQEQPTYDPTVGDATVDGSATLTARDGFTRAAAVATLTSDREFDVAAEPDAYPDGWFDEGLLVWETGPTPASPARSSAGPGIPARS